MIEVRKALPSDIERVADLWQYAFRDSKNFVKWYFEQYAIADEIYIAEEQGELLAAAQSISRTWKSPTNTLPTRYIVGVSSYPQARGKGIVSALMQRIHEDARKEGVAFTILMPFEASFYMPYGYYWCDYHLQIQEELAHLPKQSDYNGRFKPTTITEEIRSIYETFFEQNHVHGLLRNERFWRSFYEDLMLESGYLYKYENAQKETKGYVAYVLRDDELFVREAIYLDQDAQNAIYTFLRNHRSQVRRLFWSAPLWETAGRYQSYAKNAVTMEPFMMARIDDLKPFIKSRPTNKITFTIEKDCISPETHWQLEKEILKPYQGETDFVIARNTLVRLVFKNEPLAYLRQTAAVEVRNETAWNTFLSLFDHEDVFTNAYF